MKSARRRSRLRAYQAALRLEQAALSETLSRVGPDAPTLCKGWRTADLAAHLAIIQSYDPRYLPGTLFGRWLSDSRLASYSDRLMGRAKARGYDWALAKLRGGPPMYWRYILVPMNVAELWIHHEDVLRAADISRSTDRTVDQTLWRALKLLGRILTLPLRPLQIEVETPTEERHTLRRGRPYVRLRGQPGELLLFLAGREAVAHVEIDAPGDAANLLSEANLNV